MPPITSLLHELRFETLKVALLNGFLDATILFLGLVLILSIFSIGIMIPLIVAILFLIFDIWRYMRKVSLRYIEDRNPEVREMLRTAADNKHSDSLMAQALFADVIERMRRISGGTLLDFQKIGLKLAALFLLSLILVSLAFFNIDIQKFQNPLAKFEDKVSDYWNKAFGDANETDANVTDADDSIYGDPSLAKLGDQALDVKLQQNLNQIDFNQVSSADQLASTLDGYPVNTSARASQAYTGGISDVNDRKAAAEYSQQIK